MNAQSHLNVIKAAGCVWLGLAALLLLLAGAPAVYAGETGPDVEASAVITDTLAVLSGPVPDIPADYMIVEGDIQIPKTAFAARYLAGPNGTFESNRWPNGVVTYEFDANVTAISRTMTLQAMSDWEAISSVWFTQCATNPCSGAFIHIQASNANNSAIGRTGGRQVVNLVSWNSRYIIAHELGHALGLEHEQSRNDRSTYIQVNYNNVCQATDAACLGGFCFDNNGMRIDCDFNFDVAPNSWRYGGYDFDSVMHYGRADFSRNGNDTVTVLAPFTAQWQDAIGQRAHLSEGDKNVMGCIYSRANWRWGATASAFNPNGTCFFPYIGWASAVSGTPAGGTLWLEPGSYTAVGVYDKAMTLKAPNGTVVLGQ